MKILFIFENMAERCGANVNIALALIEDLKKEHDIDVLVRYDETKPIDASKTSVFNKVYSFYSSESGDVGGFTTNNNWSKCSVLKKIFLLYKNPKELLYMLDIKYFDSQITRHDYRRELECICQKERYDVVIGVAAPYYISRVIASARIESYKALIQLDPYTYNYTLPSNKINKRKRIEKDVIDKLDLLFVVSYLKKELINNGICLDDDKVVSFELPGIRKAKTETVKCRLKNDGNIHFVFVGQFYDRIRNPLFLLKLFEQLPENYILHLVGGGAQETVDKFKEILGNRMVCHGWVSSTDANELLQKADILINLNNNISNQLASKLFEYISTGKPILNICKLSDCLSLEFANKYSNCITIHESENTSNTVIKDIIKFVDTHIGTRIEFDIIENIFFKNTDTYIAEQIHEQLRNMRTES